MRLNYPKRCKEEDQYSPNKLNGPLVWLNYSVKQHTFQLILLLLGLDTNFFPVWSTHYSSARTTDANTNKACHTPDNSIAIATVHLFNCVVLLLISVMLNYLPQANTNLSKWYGSACQRPDANITIVQLDFHNFTTNFFGVKNRNPRWYLQ